MSSIKIMSDLLANKIAAGEVIEKVASVVKELVENAIDAKASIIEIEVLEAGTKLIKVTDNGIGMTREDAALALERHATSKLLSEDDLFNISTLGFRGEALPSIASVSMLELQTSKGEVGTKITVNGGHVDKIVNSDARIGTMVSVANLFYNTPARLKHMSSLYTELANITNYVNKIALAHPEIKFILTSDHNTLLNTEGKGNLLKTINDVYGLEVTKKMLPISGHNLDYEVSGYIALPEINRTSRNYMTTIVNGRVVRNMDLNRTINDAYHSFKPDTRYPLVVINITVDPAIIDVNVHPTKMDIKFGKLEALESLITSLIKGAISTKNLIPEERHFDIGEQNEIINLDDVIKPVLTQPTLDLERDITPVYETEVVVKAKRMPEMEPIGVIHGTYIICQNELGMYLIDQHAAKERINYEHYKKMMAYPNGKMMTLLIPITIELPKDEFIIINENIPFIRSLGFDIEIFGESSLIIKAHPTWLPVGYEQAAIMKIIEVIVSLEHKFTIEKFNEAAATMLACKMAIKANMAISLKEMEQLINDLRKCDNPFNCPHGRPTIIFYSNYDLEKLFKRSGF